MAELKNTFIKSKMNKDLDSRLLPNGEYRDSVNVSVSTSEGPDVGAVENIVSNFALSNFNIKNGDCGLEIIGYHADDATDNVFVFITNYTDLSSNRFGNFAPDYSGSSTSTKTRNGTSHYICLYNVNTNEFNILVEGVFLNFSKNKRIFNCNVLEDLFFWTDNRNQPRKINWKKALQDSSYYSKEEHISVAKFAPYSSIKFKEDMTGFNPVDSPQQSTIKSTLKNETEKFLPTFFSYPGLFKESPSTTGLYYMYIDEAASGQTVDLDNVFGISTNFDREIRTVRALNKTKNDNVEAFIFNYFQSGTFTNGWVISFCLNPTDTSATFNPEAVGWEDGDIIEFQLKNPDYNAGFNGDRGLLKEKFPKFSYRYKFDDDEFSIIAPWSQAAFIPNQFGYFHFNDDEKAKKSSIVDFMTNWVTTAGLYINLPCPPNELLEKYHIKQLQLLYSSQDDVNAKVIAELSGLDLEVGSVAEVELVSGGQNYPTNIQGTIGEFDNPVSPGDPWLNLSDSKGKFFAHQIKTNNNGEVELDSSTILVTKGIGYKVGELFEVPPLPINPGTFVGSGAIVRIKKLTNDFLYNYTSQKPLRNLLEKELLRVSDIAPIQAKTQETVGNRIIYGNFLAQTETPETLKYGLSYGEKFQTPYTVAGATSTQKIQYRNHTIKQNRSYQVGVVLFDMFGRSSNVILNDKNEDSSISKATIKIPYTNAGVDPMRWQGDNLKFELREVIPPNSDGDYIGLWSETNPLGWYSYRIVVKQQEQDYYNVYVPGSLSGNVVFKDVRTQIDYTNENTNAHLALFNSNINKVPRDINELGPSDNIYASNIILYARTKDTIQNDNLIDYPNLRASSQVLNNQESFVKTIKPFSEFGEWTTRKGKDAFWDNASWDDSIAPNGAWTGEDKYNLYCYPDDSDATTLIPTTANIPSSSTSVDPFYLDDNPRPVIASLSTKNRIGFTSDVQFNRGDDLDAKTFSKNLIVLETKPVQSKVDVFFESSSSGLISDLNQSVIDDLPTLFPTGITNFTGQFSEDQPEFSAASNVFEVVAGSTLLNDPLSTVRILEVKNGLGVVQNPSPFSIEEVTPGSVGNSPTYQVTTTRYFTYTAQSAYSDEYTLKMVAEDGQGNQSTPFYNTLKLTNVAPLITRVTTYHAYFFNAWSINDRTTFPYYEVINPYTYPPLMPRQLVTNPIWGNTVPNNASPYVQWLTYQQSAMTPCPETIIGFKSWNGTPDINNHIGHVAEPGSPTSFPEQVEPREMWMSLRTMRLIFFNDPFPWHVNTAGQVGGQNIGVIPIAAIEDFNNGTADPSRKMEGIHFEQTTSNFEQGIIDRQHFSNNPAGQPNNLSDNFQLKNWTLSSGSQFGKNLFNAYKAQSMRIENPIGPYSQDNQFKDGLKFPDGTPNNTPVILFNALIPPLPNNGWGGARLSKYKDDEFWSYPASNSYYRVLKYTFGFRANDANSQAGSKQSPEFMIKFFLIHQ